MKRNLILGAFPQRKFLSGAYGHELSIFRTAEQVLLSRGVPRGTHIEAEFVDGVLVLINKDKNQFNL